MINPSQGGGRVKDSEEEGVKRRDLEVVGVGGFVFVSVSWEREADFLEMERDLVPRDRVIVGVLSFSVALRDQELETVSFVISREEVFVSRIV
jgi:hypothetical protein